MTKEEVYKLIEYDGIYDEKVKKNLKKIIKKYHPDKQNGDNKIIKVIYEVKKELENNNVTYKKNEKNKINNSEYIDKNECIIKIEKLCKKKDDIANELKNNYVALSGLFKEYSDLYEVNCSNQNTFCEIQDKFNQNNKIKLYELIIYLGLIISIIYSILNYHIISIMTGIIFVIIVFYLNYQRYLKYKKVNEHYHKLKNKIKKYDIKINEIREKINTITEKIRLLELEDTKISNDIRFWKNRFK